MSLDPQTAFAQALADFNGDRLGVAVSGGGDSMAVLGLAYAMFGAKVYAVTVDHGLRSEAADEAAMVAQFCADRDIPHETIKWGKWGGTGNLQAAARDARYAIINEWAEYHNIEDVLLGHTQDDQAETVLMALCRGSGVDGLTGMGAVKNTLYRRPVLQVSRSDLRSYLTENDIPWVEDPSNDDTAFNRVRVRMMMEELAELGLTTPRLLQAADHMRKAQRSLNNHAQHFAQQYVHTDAGDLVFDPVAFQLDRSDTEGRVLAAAIKWIGGSDYRPRYDALKDAAAAVLRGEMRTLGGVVLTPQGDKIRLCRELGAIRAHVICDGSEQMRIWDGRWRIAPMPPKGGLKAPVAQFEKGLVIKALGDDLRHCPDWRATGLSRQSLMASPSLWRGTALIAAPVAGFANGWNALIVADFHSSLLTH